MKFDTSQICKNCFHIIFKLATGDFEPSVKYLKAELWQFL
jgi:hypothetical protein